MFKFNNEDFRKPSERHSLVLIVNPLNANFTKWSNTLKQFVGNLPTNCLSVFDHIVGLVLKLLNMSKAPGWFCDHYC